MNESQYENTTGYSATFHKGYKLFSGVHVYGERALLQGPHSDVQLVIPEGCHGFISGHSHTDFRSFLHLIPVSDCLVSPIVEYNCTFALLRNSRPFLILIPHCVRDRKLFQDIRVWHGDIYSKTPFRETLSFSVNKKYVTIRTTCFSQFFCTIAGCRENCYGNPKAFIFGQIKPCIIPYKAELRVFMCSPLYDIYDFTSVSDC